MVRDPKTGRKKRQRTEQDPSRWIDVEGASPRIVDRQKRIPSDKNLGVR